MFSGITNEHLYTAIKLELQFSNGTPSDDKSWSGTAFIVKNSKDQFCIVTNRHVVDPDYAENGKFQALKLKLNELKVRLRLKDPATGLPDRYEELSIRNSQIHFPADQEEDVAVLKNFQVAKTLSASSTVNLDFWIPHSMLATKINFDTSQFWVGDLVAFPGYPEWHDAKNFRPILRTGSLASDPRYAYQQPNIKGRSLAFEAFSFGGSSGSPVFAMQRGFTGDVISTNGYRQMYLIGVNAGHLPVNDSASGVRNNSHSGISYFYTSAVILELLDK